MDIRTTTAFALLATMTACPMDDSGPVVASGTDSETGAPGTTESTGDGDGDPGDGDGDATETGGDGDGDPGDGDGDGEPGLMRWAVLDVNQEFIGWLDSPAPEAVLDHADVFGKLAEGSARDLFLERDGWGFMLVSAGVTFSTLGHDDVLFSGPGCTGQAMDYIASDAQGIGLGAGGCDDESIAALPQEQLHYLTEPVWSTWMESTWPGVEGQWPGAVGLRIANAWSTHWYELPTEQAWPEVLVATSVRKLDGSCMELAAPIDVCAVRLNDTDYVAPQHLGPYSLVQLPWE
jgi:hypothetical protein